MATYDWMVDALLIALAGAVGVLIGAVTALGLRARRDRRLSLESPRAASGLPSGAAAVLALLRSSAVVLDSSDRVVRASSAAYSVGLVRAERLCSDAVLQLVRAVRRDGVIREAELELPRGSLGSATMAVSARIAPLGSALVLVLIEDRTEARRVDAVRRDFIANVSHELKTPVGAISLLAEAMVDGADDAEAVRRFADRMQQESARLSRLVQDVIELSRLQGHDPLQEPVLVSLDDVVGEAADRCRLVADTRHITLDVSAGTGVKVRGDARQLVTAVGNLIDNAVRYAPERSRVGVTVAAAPEHEGAVAEISVSDEGPGIAVPERERIFERFYRIDSARSRDTGGTGLGLAIVKHVAAGHAGEVTVWSSLGAGSTFTVRLPVANGVTETQ